MLAKRMSWVAATLACGALLAGAAGCHEEREEISDFLHDLAHDIDDGGHQRDRDFGDWLNELEDFFDDVF